MKKILIFVSAFLSVLCLSFFFIYNQWKSYNPSLASMMWSDNFKTLYLESTIQKGQYSIIVDFNYSDSELSQFSMSKIDSLKFFYIKNDTTKIYFNGGTWLRSKKIPILERDSIPFPESFSIKIYNEDYTELLKYINFEEFEKIAKADFLKSSNNFLTAKEWVLTIDSTLLDLDKTKIDSIR